MYSALKVDGQKLYEIARRGGEVAREARPITIEELTVLGEADGDYVLRVRCSKALTSARSATISARRSAAAA